MTNKLKHIRSSIPGDVPAPETLELGRIAVNTADGKLFIKKEYNGVVEVIEIGQPTSILDQISDEPLNRLVAKSDGFYVSDDLTPDPLAYYILAKG